MHIWKKSSHEISFFLISIITLVTACTSSRKSGVRLIKDNSQMVKLRVFYRPPIHPEGIRFSDHSVQDVMIQISRAYRKKYVCFIKPIDTAAVDELGGGCMGTDESLDNMLAFCHPKMDIALAVSVIRSL